MINTEAFAQRLQQIMEYYGLSAAAFSEKIGVQRSSISHLLSGRNKPSLDFVLKITEAFNEVDLYWLVNGKGSFPSENKQTSTASTLDTIDSSFLKKNSKTVEISKVIIFYKDGTFEIFEN